VRVFAAAKVHSRGGFRASSLPFYCGHWRSAVLRMCATFVSVALLVLAGFTVMTTLPFAVAFAFVCSLGADDIFFCYGLCMCSQPYRANSVPPISFRPRDDFACRSEL